MPSSLQAVLLFACSLSFVSSQTSSLESEVQAFSCLLKDNRTEAANFLASIKAKYEVSKGVPLRTLAVSKGSSVGFKCFSQNKCPGASSSWCFNLYHSERLIELCWDSNNQLLNATDAARELGLDKYFTVGRDCTGVRGPCIAVHNPPLFIDGGILTCTSHNATCTAKSLAKVSVLFSPATFRNPEIISNSTSELVLGQQNVYYFRTRIPYASYLSFAGFRNGISPIGIYHNETFLDYIPEYPFCDAVNCSERDRAGARFNEQRQQRVRVYSYFAFVANCPEDYFEFYTWILIDNARESDADDAYGFILTVQTSLFPPRLASREIVLNLTAVAPIVNSTAIRVPSDSNVTAGDGSNSTVTMIELGQSVEWRVSAQAGVEDRLVWMLDGQELPGVAAAQNHNMDVLCSRYNGTYYMYESQQVSRFFSNFTSSLFLCNFSHPHTGHYECAVVHSWGNHDPATLWSTVARVLRHPNITTEPITEKGLTTTAKVSVQPFVIVYIVVGVFVPVLLVTVLFMLLCMVLCIKRAQRRRLYKSKRPSRRSDIVIQSFTNRAQFDRAWSRSNSQPSISDDELEFPREKLVFLNKVLGNGTFGIVLLAKAEGIVRDSPDRNIVAIKTQKPSAPSSETDSLWQELQIMRSMKPHPHLVNLLGYTRQTASHPLYLIVEFALYGSLQTFLQECEEVVLRLNHTPRVISRHNSGTAESSVYANMRKLSELSQSEPCSPTTPSSVSVSFAAASSEQSIRALSLQRDYRDDVFSTETSARACPDECPADFEHDYINSKGLLYMEDVHMFALQIARGLKHLKQQNIVHCDLAARNILISEGFVLKIGDFGMAKEMSEKEYYRRSEGRIPVKWTAPEALEEHIFSHKSDIWSYAVILWEIFSYGHRPYSDVKIGQSWEPFIRILKAGRRLSQPDGCPDPFYKLMEHCWQLNPAARPSATDLVRLLESCSDLSRDTDHQAAEGVRARETASPALVVEDCVAPAAQSSAVGDTADTLEDEQHGKLSIKPSSQSQESQV